MISLSVISVLNALELICLRTSIAIVSTQVNGFNYCYLTLIILFDNCCNLTKGYRIRNNQNIVNKMEIFITLNKYKTR